MTSTERESASDADTSAAGDTPRKKHREVKARDRNAGIRPVGDIDFVPLGKQSLKELFEEKAPVSDMDQVLVICFFLQRTVESTQIGPGHVLSGFTHVGKPVPKNLKQTIRNIKDKKAWLNFTDIENIRVTTEGENHVEYALGKGSSELGAN